MQTHMSTTQYAPTPASLTMSADDVDAIDNRSEPEGLSGAALVEPSKTDAGQAKSDSIEVRTFFVKPPQWIVSDMVPALIRAEVPGHVIDDHLSLKRICDKFPGSLIVINGDKIAGNEKVDWKYLLNAYRDVFIRSRVTVAYMDRGLSLERQREIRVEGVTMAFIELNQSFKTVQNLLFAIAVKVCKSARRNFIRISCEQGQGQPEFNLKMHGIMVRGKVRDISSSGMACYLEDETVGNVIQFTQGEEIRGMQLLLRGTPVLVSGQVAAVRKVGTKNVAIVMFRWKDDTRGRDRIHQYIGQRLQEDFKRAAGVN